MPCLNFCGQIRLLNWIDYLHKLFQELWTYPKACLLIINDMADEGELVDGVSLVVGHLTDSENGEPPMKRAKIEEDALNPEQSIKQILFNINKAICLRLDSIESKLEMMSSRTKILEEKVEQVSNQVKNASSTIVASTPFKAGRSGAVIVGLPQDRNSPGALNNLDGSMHSSVQNLGPNVQLITLNSEEDYPSGSWLGDETNPEMRVRVPISPSDLLHVHSNCRTPEKMGLTLLDYLFDRDTQATSNLSGMGKYGKKQLDPLMIYGIRCHLIHRFNITEQDWHRIKQNIDSKCRTAFRRKMKGLPLTVKAFRGKGLLEAPPTYIHLDNGNPNSNLSAIELGTTSDDSLQGENELHIQSGDLDLAHAISTSAAAEIIQSAAGEIQVLHATPEQVAQLQQAHQIQILQGDASQVLLQGGDFHGKRIHVLNTEGGVMTVQQIPVGDDEEQSMLQDQEGIQVAVSMSDRIHVVNSAGGEDIQELGGAHSTSGDLDTDADTETEQ